MTHDRIHARESGHHGDRWSAGTVTAVDERDGHCVVTVRGGDGETVDPVVTFAVRDPFLYPLDCDNSPVASVSDTGRNSG